MPQGRLFPGAEVWRLGSKERSHSGGGWDSGRPSDCPCLAATPPPPTLTLDSGFAGLLRPGSRATLTCVAPLSGVKFQLRRGEEVLQVPMASTSPDRVFFQLNTLAPGDGGDYTCRYRLPEELAPWSLDSAPAELVLSDGEPGGCGSGEGGRGRSALGAAGGETQGRVPVTARLNPASSARPQFPQLRTEK